MKTICIAVCTIMLTLMMPVASSKGQAKDLATFFDVNTFGCIHVELAKFDSDAFVKIVERRQELLSLTGSGSRTANGIVGMSKMVAGVADRLKAAGATDVFIPIGLSMMANESPLLIIKGNVGNAFEGLLETRKIGSFTLAANEQVLEKYVVSSSQPHRADLANLVLRGRQDAVVTVYLKPSSDHVRVLRETVAELPKPFAKLNGPLVADAIEYVSLSLRNFTEPKIKLILQGKNDEVVQQFSTGLRNGLLNASATAEANPAGKVLSALSNVVSSDLQNGRLTLTLPANGLDAFERSIQPGVSNLKSRRAEVVTQNQIRQLAISFHNIADSNKGALPAMANKSAAGKPLLSWRVHALRFMDDNGLYEQFHLDEPWDSPHNKQLISKMPAIYSATEGWLTKSQIEELNKSGKTIFVMPVGNGMFGRPDPVKFKEFKDGTSNTIIILTAPVDKAVVWTKPDDLSIDDTDPKASVFSGTSRTVVSMGDASTHVFESTIDSITLKAFLTLAGEEIIEFAK